jgi:hypothetical protein
MSSLQNKLTENLLQPVIVGAVAGLGYRYFFGSIGNVNLLGVSVNDGLAVGVSVGAASAFSETIKFWVLPYIPANKSLAGIETMLLSPMITGVTSTAAINLLTNVESKSYFQSFLLGAGSHLVGEYAYRTGKQMTLRK